MNKKVYTFALSCLLGFPVSSHAQVFKNNNSLCEAIQVAGDFSAQVGDLSGSQSIACGNFNDDSVNAGYPNFIDCIVQRDPMAALNMPLTLPISNNLLLNTGARNDNCIDAGDSNSPFAPVQDLTNQGFNPQNNPSELQMGSIQVGNLDNQNFDDVAVPFVFDDSNPMGLSQIHSFWSEANGGFTGNNLNPNDIQDLASLRTPFPSAFYANGAAVASARGTMAAQPSLQIHDCDNDGDDDLIVPVRLDEGQSGVSILVNDGSGNFSDSALINLPFQFVEEIGIASTIGDFNGDEIPDLILAGNSDENNLDSALFCAGDGQCNFDCPDNVGDPRVVNLSTLCSNDGGDNTGCDNPFPTSIASGNFDLNPGLDFVVAEPGSNRVRYLFNNDAQNGQISQWANTPRFPSATAPFEPRPLVVNVGQFTEAAFAQDLDEVVLTLPIYIPGGSVETLNLQHSTSNARLIPVDENGNLADEIDLDFSYVFASDIEAVDLDRCGGDDVVLLASDSGSDSFALIFINENESPEVTASTPLETEVNVPLQLTSACQDPTRDDRLFQWEVLTAPANATVTLGTPQGDLIAPSTDSSTSFEADIPGDYSLRVICTDFCGLSVETIVNLKVNEAITTTSGDTTTTDGTGTGSTDGIETATQGGCLANLNPSSQFFNLWNLIGCALGLGGIFFRAKRR